MKEDLKKDIEALRQRTIEWRRDFHRFPETAFNEQRTSDILRVFMEDCGLRVTSCGNPGLRGVLEGDKSGRTVALRADMDALPLQEETDKKFKSQNAGACHACGHDGHMAILMTVCRVLSQIKKKLPGNIIFLFQPSEERIPGGAKGMIKEGALDGVDAVFGLHLWQPLPTGTVGIAAGPLMAQPDAFTITVKGTGGHGSMPHQTVDPIHVAAQIVVGAQSIISRNLDPLDPGVLSFGTIQGGTISNIIPEVVTLTGTVRSFDPGVKQMIRNNLERVVEGTARAFGAEARFVYEDGYPPVINPPEMTEFVRKTAERLFGADRILSMRPVMGGEDFSYFLQKVPGAFFFFGAGDNRPFPHHHPSFDIDETALSDAALLMTHIALDFLQFKKQPFGPTMDEGK